MENSGKCSTFLPYKVLILFLRLVSKTAARHDTSTFALHVFVTFGLFRKCFTELVGLHELFPDTPIMVLTATLLADQTKELRDGPLEKLWGRGGGVFEPQEFFFVIKFPV